MILRIPLSLLIASVGSLGVCLAPGAGEAATARTQIVIYSPFTIDGQLARGVTVAGSRSGSCWEGSLASARPDAWRCVSGSSILDPCYSGPASWVACATTMADNRVVRLLLTRPLPATNQHKSVNTRASDPERIVLANGVTCGFLTGATETVAEQRLNYGCTNGAWLVGDPDRSSASWTILYLRSLTARWLTPAAIAVARW